MATGKLTSFDAGSLVCYFGSLRGHPARSRLVLSGWMVMAAIAGVAYILGVCAGERRTGFGPKAWRQQSAGLLLQLWVLVLIPTIQSMVEPFATDWDPLVDPVDSTSDGWLSVGGTDYAHPRMFACVWLRRRGVKNCC